VSKQAQHGFTQRSVCTRRGYADSNKATTNAGGLNHNREEKRYGLSCCACTIFSYIRCFVRHKGFVRHLLRELQPRWRWMQWSKQNQNMFWPKTLQYRTFHVSVGWKQSPR